MGTARWTNKDAQAGSAGGDTTPGLLRRRTMLAGSVAAAAGGLAAFTGVDTAEAAPPARPGTASKPGPAFALTVAPKTDLAAGPGRAFVIIARPSDLSAARPEPRDNVRDTNSSVPLFGMDVAYLKPGRPVVLSSSHDEVVGYPLATFADVPSGEYVVQGFFNTYETDHRSDGSVIQVHWPNGDGGDIWHSPGNVYSTPRTVHINGNSSATIQLTLNQVIGPIGTIPPGGTGQQGNPQDSKHVKHLKIRSTILSAFWGRDVYLGADVLLPEGYDDPANRNVRYPMDLAAVHYPLSNGNPRGFDESLGNDFSKWWVSKNAARFISVVVRSENPFYDDSYHVNSANIGPYGDAVDQELIPAIDRAFRTIGQRWGRTIQGGSTGGYIAAAALVFYPDTYAGAWVGYPDPIDFRAHEHINIYSDPNAFFTENPWVRVPRPGAREISGDTIWTVGQENAYERTVASRGRSHGTWDIWQALFSPQGKDGYPAPIWDKETGVIDHDVAAYWQQHWDLSSVITARWNTLGPKIAGRMQLYVGSEDTYFLANAVEFFEQRTNTLTSPQPDFQFIYGLSKPHGWTPVTTAELLTTMADFIAKHAPSGTDVSGWRGSEQPPTFMVTRGRQVVDEGVDSVLSGYHS
ncbi:alpha/beta hydrolase-fold protein [Micromonospora sp. NPDC005161]